MKPSEALSGLWLEIAGEGHSARGFYYRRLPACSALSAFAGIAIPFGRRILAIEIPRQGVLAPRILNQSRGFTVESSTECIDGRTRTIISLTEAADGSTGLFEEVAADILNLLSSSKDEESVVKRILRRLEIWQRFFRNDPGMGRQEYLGLCAELLLAEWLLVRGISSGKVLSAWRGPLGGSQDFQFGAAAIEVKCSSAVDSSIVRISSTRQLDSTGLDSLFLFHASVDFRENSGRTLVSIYHELQRKLAQGNSGNSAVFEDLMLSAGFNERFVGKYETYGVTPRETAFFEVRKGFPAIDEATLSPGITDVSFSLDLSSCQDYVVDESLVQSTLKDYVND